MCVSACGPIVTWTGDEKKWPPPVNCAAFNSIATGGLFHTEPLNWQIGETLSNWKAQVVELKTTNMALAVEHGDQLASKSHNNLTYNMDYHKSYQHLLHLSGHPLNEAPSPPVASSSNGRSASPNLPPPDNADSKVYPEQ